MKGPSVTKLYRLDETEESAIGEIGWAGERLSLVGMGGRLRFGGGCGHFCVCRDNDEDVASEGRRRLSSRIGDFASGGVSCGGRRADGAAKVGNRGCWRWATISPVSNFTTGFTMSGGVDLDVPNCGVANTAG